jgi:hypothetical protein
MSTTQPIPPGPHIRVCIMCHYKGRITEATRILIPHGFALCDSHQDAQPADILKAKHQKPR